MSEFEDTGQKSAEDAKAYSEAEFEKYRPIQDKLFRPDFDRLNDGSLTCAPSTDE